MTKITCQAPLEASNDPADNASVVVVTLPDAASKQLSSKGMVMVKGTINGVPFQLPLEPNGKGSHWFRVQASLLKKIGALPGDTVALAFETTKDWPEPKVPAAFQRVLDSDPTAKAVWDDITPMARWDWLRWIRAARQEETRAKHLEVARSKLHNGMRRPCCFNRTACTLTDA